MAKIVVRKVWLPFENDGCRYWGWLCLILHISIITQSFKIFLVLTLQGFSVKFSINSLDEWKKSFFFNCFWISHLFNIVKWLSLLEDILKHFRYFQSLLVLPENSTAATSPFSYRKLFWDTGFSCFYFLSLPLRLGQLEWGSLFQFTISLHQTDKSKHLAVWNRTVEQNWKLVCSYMQDWEDCKVRRAGLETWTFIPFFYLYLKTVVLFQRCEVDGLGSIVLACLRKMSVRVPGCWFLLPLESCCKQPRIFTQALPSSRSEGWRSSRRWAHSRGAVLQCKCMEKAKEVKGVAVKVKCKINQNTK